MPLLETQLVTAEEFAGMEFGDKETRHDLVRGEVVEMPRPIGIHGIIQFKIAWLLMNLVIPKKLGWVLGESGIVLDRDPDSVRGPDVYFYDIKRHPQPPTKFFEIPPDLAVEVLSPSDEPGETREKIREYIQAGVKIVWKVDPDEKTVTVYTGNMRGVEYGEEETITGGDVLPEFSCSVAEFFL